MSFKNSWCPASIAAEWPKGSAVLARVRDQNQMVHHYSYFFTLYLEPSSIDDKFEYLLLEEPREQQ